MFLEVKSLPECGIEFERDIDLRTRIEQYDEIQSLQLCRIAATIRPIGQERYRLEGDFFLRAEMVCTRCLAVFPIQRERPVQLRLFPEKDNTSRGEEEQEVDTSLLDVFYYGAEGIDLRQVAEEQLNLCLSMKMLCREDCRGLCPKCGANLNQGDCGCPAGDIDPRLAALKKLLD